MKLNNKYYLLRHGEAMANVKNFCSSWPEQFKNPLTKNGKKQAAKAAEELSNKGINLIFSSDLLRTKQTAKIVAGKLKLKVMFDKRLREIDFGIFSGKSIGDFRNYFYGSGKKSKDRVPGGESYSDVSRRVGRFFKEINKKYNGKNILIVSHQAPLLLLLGIINKKSVAKSLEPLHNVFSEKKITKGELIELN